MTKTTKKKTQSKKRTKKSAVRSAALDRRWPKVMAVICTLMAIYLLLAFTSYLTSWSLDQDKVHEAGWSLLLEDSTVIHNWLGALGAVVSHKFFFLGAGLASFVLVLPLLKLAHKLFTEVPWKGFRTALQYSLVFVLIVSPLLSFVLSDSAFPWGGAYGDYVSGWLRTVLGTIGAALLFVFIGIGFIVWNFHQLLTTDTFSFKWPKMSLAELLRPGTKEPAHMDSDTYLAQKKDRSSPIETLKPTEPGPIEFDIPKVPVEKRKKSTDPSPTPELELKVTSEPPASAPDPEEKPMEITPLKVEKPREQELIVEQENKVHLDPYDPTADLSRYERPRLINLVDYSDSNVEINREELEQNKDQIIRTLLHYKIEITKIQATIGPTVTLYEIVPAPGVRISKIKNLEDDIALSLAALGIRIIAPIPGKGTIGIEVPNKNKQIVGLKEVLSTEKFKQAKMDLPIALGKTIANEVFIADLTKMPHLLIAGATGQGKSVGINTILMSLLYKKHPSQVKLVLIDPKKVELFPYRKLSDHFLAFLPNQDEPIITETKKVVYTLNSLCIEMDQRYDLLKKAHARNIKEYNKKFVARRLNPGNGHRFMPFIVLVIDEFADLIMTAGKEVELPIARLAQLARAVGIHLIIATQRPSVNIITGVIKANFPARLAFRVTSKVDSRTILDAGGADQLIGRGDMLLTVGGDMIRLQCAFVDTPEVEKVIDSISEQQGFPSPFFLPEYDGEEKSIGGGSGLKESDLDDMFQDAALLVVQNQQGSTSMIQRRLKLGYNRAGRIMDQLEALGIVGPSEGSKAREVYLHTEQELFHHLEQLQN
ncbi:MAG: DNA translocase FtsK [Saprospiraceae bacterium]|nr:DNA translocase FtsK [Saprospiraceae bacterium]